MLPTSLSDADIIHGPLDVARVAGVPVAATGSLFIPSTNYSSNSSCSPRCHLPSSGWGLSLCCFLARTQLCSWKTSPSFWQPLPRAAGPRELRRGRAEVPPETWFASAPSCRQSIR